MGSLHVKQIAVGDLVLDPRNPRIAPMLDSFDSEPTMEWILLVLGRFSSVDEDQTTTSYSSLKESIRANKGVMQPITVSPASEGKYVVIEGNTRVAIYLELAKENAEGEWSTIPAIVHADGDERGEHAIRLQAHLVGPRPWRPYAKAKYLHDLYHGPQKISLTEIYAICGGTGRRKEIEEYIAAFADMQGHYVPLHDNQPLDQSRFSAFVELQKPPILQALAKHGYTKSDFAKWVGTPDDDAKFKPLHTVRQLPRILNNPAAKQKFLTRDASEALRVLEQPASSEIIKGASIEQLASALAVKLRTLLLPDITALAEDPENRTAQAIEDCYLELKTLNKFFNSDSDD